KIRENTLYGTDSVKFISVIIHLLCGAIALIRESMKAFLADTATILGRSYRLLEKDIF
ncbi:hypothetical protein EZS27_030369, partial [termite gut metagenome]